MKKEPIAVSAEILAAEPLAAEPLAADALELDRQICFPLYAAANAMVRAYRPHLEPLGLTYPQYLVLLVLWEGDSLGVGEIGDRLHLDSGTLTPLLKRMEAAGLVERRRGPEDERRVAVTLTPKGRRLRTAAAAIPPAMARQIGMEEADIGRLRGVLHALIGRIDAAGPGEAGQPR